MRKRSTSFHRPPSQDHKNPTGTQGSLTLDRLEQESTEKLRDPDSGFSKPRAQFLWKRCFGLRSQQRAFSGYEMLAIRISKRHDELREVNWRATYKRIQSGARRRELNKAARTNRPERPIAQASSSSHRQTESEVRQSSKQKNFKMRVRRQHENTHLDSRCRIKKPLTRESTTSSSGGQNAAA